MINFANLALNLEEILHLTTAVVGADTPVVVSAINTARPGTVSSQTNGYIALGELGLGLIDQILSAIVAAHAAKIAVAAPPAPTGIFVVAPPPPAAPPVPAVEQINPGFTT